MYCERKNAYKSEHQAKIVKKLALRQRNRKLRVYKCPECHKWHLTSEDKWHEPEEHNPYKE